MLKNYSPKNAILYREYRNDFLSVEKFSEYLKIPVDRLKEILENGKFSHNVEAAAQKIPNFFNFIFYYPQNYLEIFFDGIHSKKYSIIEGENEIILKEKA